MLQSCESVGLVGHNIFNIILISTFDYVSYSIFIANSFTIRKFYYDNSSRSMSNKIQDCAVFCASNVDLNYLSPKHLLAFLSI